MKARGRDIIVIGTSAGGLEALDRLVAQLPGDIPAAILIVQHMHPEQTGHALLRTLGKYEAFRCKLAAHGDTFRPGRISIAPPDNHLLVKGRRLLVTKGARENRSRPGIDPLFRSVAVEHGPHVIGVLLTGMLDDGTAGLVAIRKCGGVTVVQDPDDATYPGMPRSAVANARVDHCVPLGEMGVLLDRLSREPAGKARKVPDDVRTEARIAERILSDVAAVEGLGDLVPHNCPNCGGVLWQMDHHGVKRYRCHTGHSYTSAALLVSQSERIEETLWVAMRMFEERKNLLNGMTGAPGIGRVATAQRIREAQGHIDLIRSILAAPGVNEEAIGPDAPAKAGRHGSRERPARSPARERATRGG
jgi:two-component system chemotaxis response regulator CheB